MTQATNLFPSNIGAVNNVYKKIIDAGDMSADIDSGPFNIMQFNGFSVQIVIGAGATGEWFVQGSNVLDPTDSDWVTIPFFDDTGTATSLTTSGSAGQYLCNASEVSFSFIRVIYTATSGTGSADVWLTLKAK